MHRPTQANDRTRCSRVFHEPLSPGSRPRRPRWSRHRSRVGTHCLASCGRRVGTAALRARRPRPTAGTWTRCTRTIARAGPHGRRASGARHRFGARAVEAMRDGTIEPRLETSARERLRCASTSRSIRASAAATFDGEVEALIPLMLSALATHPLIVAAAPSIRVQSSTASCRAQCSLSSACKACCISTAVLPGRASGRRMPPSCAWTPLEVAGDGGAQELWHPSHRA